MNLYRRKLGDSDRRNKALLAARHNLILTVSHDLRTPLGTICEYAELLQDEKDTELNKYRVLLRIYVIMFAGKMLCNRKRSVY